MNLQNWANQAKAHWKEHNPKRYRALKKQGTLDLAAKKAAEQTFEEVNALEESGFQPDLAFQMVRERYLFPPEEAPEEEQGETLFQAAIKLQNEALKAGRALDREVTLEP